LLCPTCLKPTTPEQPFHRECILCPGCTTATMTHSSHYDFKGQTYCRVHYSLLKEAQCGGCDQTVLKNFVEHSDDTIWHPECYMIDKVGKRFLFLYFNSKHIQLRICFI
jgi:hypothetical protein